MGAPPPSKDLQRLALALGLTTTGRTRAQLAQAIANRVTVGTAAALAQKPLGVGAHASWPDDALSNGTARGENARHQQVMPFAGTDLRVTYSNANGANDIIVRASIELAGGVLLPLYFRGVRDVTLSPNGYATSDPLDVPLASATTFWTRSRVTVGTAGQKWPRWLVTKDTNGEGAVLDNTATPVDSTTSGSIAVGYDFSYGPTAVLATPARGAGQLVFGLIGDSIARGNGNEPGFDRSFLDLGLGLTRGRVKVSKSGEKGQEFVAPATRLGRLALLQGANVAVCEYGVNDLNLGRTLAQIKADLISIWQACAAQGMKVYQTTITPNTTSTDSWATAGNQTFANAAMTPGGARTLLNDWIRTIPDASLTGYIETADAVETARNSGLWKAGYTADGLHPNATGHPAMGAVVTTWAAGLNYTALFG